MSAAVELCGVTKTFSLAADGGPRGLKDRVVAALAGRAPTTRRIEVLRGVDLSVRPGRIFGIVGRNGCGKSTLLRIVAGIYRADHGTVRTHGRVGALIELGTGFHPEFSGRENVLMTGLMMGCPRRELVARAREIARFAGVEDRLDAPVRTYSSGMLARLAFSVVVHADPDVLVSDEVFAVGDARFTEQCFETIRDLRRRGRTIVLVTHDLGVVETWCDEAAWLEDGVIRASGSPAHVVAAYRGLDAPSRPLLRSVS